MLLFQVETPRCRRERERPRTRRRMLWLAVLGLSALGLAGCSEQEPTTPLIPRIVMASPEMIARVDCPVSKTRCQGGRAVYDHRTATIFLPTDWQAGDEVDVSTLLHEFAHHLQTLAGDRHGCLGDAEKEAYAVQFAWLRARGRADPLKTMGLSEMAHIMATSCRRLPDRPVVEERRSTRPETSQTNS